eukprot:766429-Hanusia_phi.AAC.1
MSVSRQINNLIQQDAPWSVETNVDLLRYKRKSVLACEVMLADTQPSVPSLSSSPKFPFFPYLLFPSPPTLPSCLHLLFLFSIPLLSSSPPSESPRLASMHLYSLPDASLPPPATKSVDFFIPGYHRNSQIQVNVSYAQMFSHHSQTKFGQQQRDSDSDWHQTISPPYCQLVRFPSLQMFYKTLQQVMLTCPVLFSSLVALLASLNRFTHSSPSISHSSSSHSHFPPSRCYFTLYFYPTSSPLLLSPTSHLLISMLILTFLVRYDNRDRGLRKGWWCERGNNDSRKKVNKWEEDADEEEEEDDGGGGGGEGGQSESDLGFVCQHHDCHVLLAIRFSSLSLRSPMKRVQGTENSTRSR